MDNAETLSTELFLNRIRELCDGLYFLSECEYPLEPISYNLTNPDGLTEQNVFEIAGKRPENGLEEVELSYFFRNMTMEYPEADEDMKLIAQRFRKLQTFLEENLQDLKVYRVGQTEVVAIILGKLNPKEYAGLKTTVVET